MLRSLLSVLTSALIFSSEQRRSPLARLPSVAVQRRRASAPYLVMSFWGSMMLPIDLDILRPVSSVMCWWIQTSLKQGLLVSR